MKKKECGHKTHGSVKSIMNYELNKEENKMAVLDSKIQEQVDALSNAAYDKLQEKAIEEGLALYEQAWNTYPAPQNNLE